MSLCRMIGHHWEQARRGKNAWWECSRCGTKRPWVANLSATVRPKPGVRVTRNTEAG